jgi:AcrR family transcriptional regulator
MLFEMSRTRVRPTRDETRQRLFEAAAEVFETQGIGAASVETICSAAGFTRGAFYSNFATKDELITAMLTDHVEQTTRRHLELLARYRDTVEFITALKAMDRSEQDPLGRSPLLHIELILNTARNREHRSALAELMQARRNVIAEIIRDTDLANGHDAPGDLERLSGMLLAMEDGFRLHRLIDPDSTPADSFLRAVSELQEVFSQEPR